MKSIYVVFEDEEFKTLKKAKKKLSWHDFVMLAVKRNPKPSGVAWLDESEEGLKRTELTQKDFDEHGKPTTDGDIEPELEKDSDFLNFNRAMEIIKELDSEFDFKGKTGPELSRHAIELMNSLNSSGK